MQEVNDFVNYIYGGVTVDDALTLSTLVGMGCGFLGFFGTGVAMIITKPNEMTTLRAQCYSSAAGTLGAIAGFSITLALSRPFFYEQKQ